MTNTLHRQGSRESLAGDFVVFLTPAGGINRQGCGEKKRRFLQLALAEGPVNLGADGKNLVTGGAPEAMIAGVTDESSVAATFSDAEAVRRLVGALKREGLGISVNISGLAEAVDDILRSHGIVRHSIEHSVGVLGRIERLPTRQVLELATMCGHGLISHNYARKMIDWVKLGKCTPRQAARHLARPCVCGAFNLDRAEALLARAVEMA
jgi:hypothetical protein